MITVPRLRDVDEICLVVRRCDEACARWAPFGWRPPPRVAIAASWRARLANSLGWARVAVEGGEIVGAVACEGSLLTSLYVDPKHWGRGVGGELLHCAEAAMHERGVKDAALWTPERSPWRGFYERRGWSADGRRALSALSALPSVAYLKDLASAAAAEAVRAGQDRAQVGDV